MDYNEVEEIKKKLLNLPAQIYDKQVEVEKAEGRVNFTEIVFDATFAKEFLTQKISGNTDSQSKSTAIYNTAPDKLALNMVEIKFKLKVAELKRLVNEFDSIKKIANIKDGLIRSGVRK